MASNATAELAPDPDRLLIAWGATDDVGPYSSQTGALSMALLALSDQSAAEVTEGANRG